VSEREFGELFASAIEEGIVADHERAGPELGFKGERCRDHD
jgi:hypothetical protein